jgi:hypothetical protein
VIKNPIHIDTQTPFYETLGAKTPVYPAVDKLLSDEDDLLLESATLEEIELAYLGDEILAESDNAMFEAITTKRIKLAQTMRAFIRVLNRSLNGTGIKAGTDEAGVDDQGQNTVGGAIIGKVRRVANIPVLTAQIPLSDGQSTSIIFHSPTAEGGRIKNDDVLVAFQFLLNKRDVTHVVAPIGGRDVSLNQVCQVLSNLIERNSPKFQKAKERQVKLKADIEGYLNETDKLTDERSTLISQVEKAQQGLSDKRDSLIEVQKKLAQQKSINADLQTRLDALKAAKENKEPERPFTDQIRTIKNGLNMDGIYTLSNGAVLKYITTDTGTGPESYVTIAAPDGNYSIKAKDMQGKNMGDAATKLLKAYREHAADKYLVGNLPGSQTEPEPAAVVEPLPEPQDTQPDPIAVVEPNPEPVNDPLPAPDLTANPPSPPEVQQDPQPEPVAAVEPSPELINANEAGTKNEVDQEADKALEYIKSVPTQFQSRNLAEVSEELDHVQEAANTLVNAGRFEENEELVGNAADHLINILAEIQKEGA